MKRFFHGKLVHVFHFFAKIWMKLYKMIHTYSGIYFKKSVGSIRKYEKITRYKAKSQMSCNIFCHIYYMTDSIVFVFVDRNSMSAFAQVKFPAFSTLFIVSKVRLSIKQYDSKFCIRKNIRTYECIAP